MVVYGWVQGFPMVCISNSSGSWAWEDGFIWLMLVFSILLLLLLPVMYWLLSQRIFRPLTRLMRTMEGISQGQTDLMAEDPKAGREIQVANETFNQMLEKIRALRIESYEQELEKKQTQLQYYRAQIRPHFYLNCLKSIYSLAEKKEFANIEQSILLLSRYLRYTFQDNANTVELQEELRQCENYISLMGVSAVYPPQIEMDVDVATMKTKVPPVSVLTIVENSIRYFPINLRQLKVSVTTKLLHTEETDFLEVTVRDNGDGFPGDVLEKMNSSDWRQDGHIGLSNIVARCRLLYGELFSIVFINDEGAVVQLYLPLGKDWGGER